MTKHEKKLYKINGQNSLDIEREKSRWHNVKKRFMDFMVIILIVVIIVLVLLALMPLVHILLGPEGFNVSRLTFNID